MYRRIIFTSTPRILDADGRKYLKVRAEIVGRGRSRAFYLKK